MMPRLTLQQYLPLAVLKLSCWLGYRLQHQVATVLTACGIETFHLAQSPIRRSVVATVLTACGIETTPRKTASSSSVWQVATVLTACGIETSRLSQEHSYALEVLQQYLPLAVLKLKLTVVIATSPGLLQQYLPLAVLKLIFLLYKLGNKLCCNSTYRLRY